MGQVGDLNYKLFHVKTRVERAKTKVISILNRSGVCPSRMEGIKDHFKEEFYVLALVIIVIVGFGLYLYLMHVKRKLQKRRSQKLPKEWTPRQHQGRMVSK